MAFTAAFPRCLHPRCCHFSSGSDMLNFFIILYDTQFGQDSSAVFDSDFFGFRMGMGEHIHDGASEKSVFESHGSLLEPKMIKVVGNGMDHTYLVFESDEIIKIGKGFDILDVCLRHASSHFP